MSFQAGTWNIDNQPANKQLLTQICKGFAELGPDGESTYIHQSVAIFHRSLHTSAESRSDRQPYRLRGGEMMTWDGRLDNRKELLGLLELELKDDLADGAIVAAAFERWRTNAFAKLIGDWALVVWHPDDRELILAKDYMGTRNLFYYVRANKVTWCTQLEPLAACGDALTLCDDYIAGYLAFHPDADLTPYGEIRSVPPARRMVQTHRG